MLFIAKRHAHAYLKVSCVLLLVELGYGLKLKDDVAATSCGGSSLDPLQKW